MLQDEAVSTGPTVIKADPVTSRYQFAAPVDFDPASHTSTAHRRRGCLVIKMAAALYLASLPA
ncbi:hypothetical protein LSCM4_04485 [Leishmania orientalis]|uniref:Uncharacterized protein n=1 Tax=Leishmania orientalis TaxID=2249476 RepID=A0A836G8G9_9TRYP|nr:hypothetical protein LSCM4_04485 [Leishmania orientalis]